MHMRLMYKYTNTQYSNTHNRHDKFECRYTYILTQPRTKSNRHSPISPTYHNETHEVIQGYGNRYYIAAVYNYSYSHTGV